MNTGLLKTRSSNPIAGPVASPRRGSPLRAFVSAAPSLELVEERVRSELGSHSSELTDISRYLLDLGGKRVRPLLAILSGKLFGLDPPSDALISAAAGIEMIHMATLLHDDIIDRSPTRRNSTSAYSKYGIGPTLLAGDFLLVKAFGTCAKLDDFVVEATEVACIELTVGEVLEGQLDADSRPSFDFYIDVVRGKTASLFGLAATVGSYLAGQPSEIVEKLKRFGYAIGVAFQIVDDILDVTADQNLLGKPAGTDLKQKTPSLVNILWLESGAKEARRFFAKNEPSGDDISRAMKELRISPIVDTCKQHATLYAERARTALLEACSKGCNEETKEDLLELINYTLGRCN